MVQKSHNYVNDDMTILLPSPPLTGQDVDTAPLFLYRLSREDTFPSRRHPRRGRILVDPVCRCLARRRSHPSLQDAHRKNDPLDAGYVPAPLRSTS